MAVRIYVTMYGMYLSIGVTKCRTVFIQQIMKRQVCSLGRGNLD
ncbi:hypothetical protein [Caldicellulosiruptor bescii]|uniref:Uncharacterized protein n=1 Tax=Caldicellulosiruptor bescii (strain ATCC BAA-1888 / DSM 6725 / KCTC 15123 / Z-1320) TaxID=521460 RepID=B9MKT8_CALBD|nr:hypothetical protein [Caldicellulosiruptor bescii]ACM60946.1 hypothetical protein Athe_1858 [Caldicellulosiruptor bescii DSM 6725]